MPIIKLMVKLFVISAVIAIFASSNGANGSNSTDLEGIARLLRGDVRVIAMGDSYSTSYWGRVATAGLRVWPIPHISAIGGGTGYGNNILRSVDYCSPVSLVQSIDSFGYSIERQSKPQQFFTLPLRGLKEIYTNKKFVVDDPDGNLFNLNLNVDELDSSVHGSFSQTGDTLQFRLLFRSPLDPNNQPESLILKDLTEQVLAFDPRIQARKMWHLGEVPDGIGGMPIPMQINAVAIDIPAVNQLGGTCRVYLAQDSPLAGTNKYFQLAGGVYYQSDESNAPSEGLYFSAVADDSWKYSGYGSNQAGVDTHDKQYSENQFTHWLDVTTLRREQPVLFVWMFDVEQLPYNTVLLQLEAMIDQADSAAASVGIVKKHHLLITPHMANIADGGDVAHALMVDHQTAAATIANARTNVFSVSLYEATDGVFFDGRSEAIQWLTEHGFNTFGFGTTTVDLVDKFNGDLLDGPRIHPGSHEAAGFFAAVIGNEIRKAGCPADVKEDGVIDIADVLLVVGNWGGQGPTDINDDGTTDVGDLLAVIKGWGDCWPVQAPFNTDTF